MNPEDKTPEEVINLIEMWGAHHNDNPLLTGSRGLKSFCALYDIIDKNADCNDIVQARAWKKASEYWDSLHEAISGDAYTIADAVGCTTIGRCGKIPFKIRRL